MDATTVAAILFILGGITGFLYWGEYMPDLMNGTLSMKCDTTTPSVWCVPFMLVGYAIFILITVGGIIGLFASNRS
jgi:uncharacterized membrane protein (UPF0136 family)